RARCPSARSGRRRAALLVDVSELAVADAHAVAAVQRLRAGQELLVQVRAVRGAEILQHHDPALSQQAGVAGGRERVLKADLGLVAAAHDRALADVVLHPRRVAGRALDDQAGLAVAVGAVVRRGVDARAVRAGRDDRAGRGRPRAAAAPQVAQGAARDPQEEEVEHGEEAELEADGDRLEERARIGVTEVIARPFTFTPFVEPRSAIVQLSPPDGRISAWRRETFESCRTM